MYPPCGSPGSGKSHDERQKMVYGARFARGETSEAIRGLNHLGPSQLTRFQANYCWLTVSFA